MKNYNLLIGVITIILCNYQLYSQKTIENLDEIVLSATKFELKKENTGKVIYKIDQNEIQKHLGASVFELINMLPGVEIRGVNSNPGEPRNIYIRGGRSRQVLILIDGIPLSDPTGIEQSYDLRLLSLNQIKSIEVLKGASSSLYGSGAGTGVINIILKKTSKKIISGTYEVGLGTNKTSNNNLVTLQDKYQAVSIRGTLNKFQYNTSFSMSGIDGISSAKSKTDIPFEEDTFTSNNGFLKLGYAIHKQFHIDAMINYDEFNYTYDAGAYNDSQVNSGKQDQLRVGIKPYLKYKQGEIFMNASVNYLDRSFDSFNSFSGGINTFNYKGTSINLDLVNKNELNANVQLVTGINFQKHDNETISDFGNIDPSIANFNVIDPYISAIYISDFGLSITLGGRLNIHSIYGNNFVYDTNSAFNIVNSKNATIKLISSYSSAFIAPSLYQLFSDYGVTSLSPETNTSVEFGTESKFGDKLQVNFVYFRRVENNKVIFQNLSTPPYGVYANAPDEINISGLEATISYLVLDHTNINLGYTYLDKNRDIDYIPSNKLTASIQTKVSEYVTISSVFKNVGQRTLFDLYGSFGEAGQDVILPSYSILDVNTTYKLLKGKLLFFGSITNVLNEDYQETIGFNTRGRNYKIGVRIAF